MTPAEATARIARALVETATVPKGVALDAPWKHFNDNQWLEREVVPGLFGTIHNEGAEPEVVAAASRLVAAVIRKARPVRWGEEDVDDRIGGAYAQAVSWLKGAQS